MSDNKQTTNVMQLTQLVIAVGALGIGGSSWFKAPDTTATTTSHALHSVEVKRLGAIVLRQHHDIKNLRAYFKGYVDEQHKAELAAEEARPRKRGAKKRTVRHAPSLPPMGEAPEAVEHLDIEEALGMDGAQLAEAMREMQLEEEELPPEFNYDQAIEDEFGDEPPPGHAHF